MKCVKPWGCCPPPKWRFRMGSLNPKHSCHSWWFTDCIGGGRIQSKAPRMLRPSLLYSWLLGELPSLKPPKSFWKKPYIASETRGKLTTSSSVLLFFWGGGGFNNGYWAYGKRLENSKYAFVWTWENLAPEWLILRNGAIAIVSSWGRAVQLADHGKM